MGLLFAQVSRRLYELTLLRSLWHSFVCGFTAYHGIPRSPSQYLSYDTRQLEELAKRPILLQDAFLRSASRPHLLPPSSDPHLGVRFELKLPEDHYTSVKMLRGGRWLLSMTVKGLLQVWNLESPSGVNGSCSSRLNNHTLYGEHRLDHTWSLLDGDVSVDGQSLYILVYQNKE
jgi:hypothetical protein